MAETRDNVSTRLADEDNATFTTPRDACITWTVLGQQRYSKMPLDRAFHDASVLRQHPLFAEVEVWVKL